MCTATWLIEDDGYQVFFNRDERRTRGEARPPTLAAVSGVRFIAPIDADAGGTWIGVNERGLTLGLLNAWQVPDRALAPGVDFRSRGLLVRDALGLSSVDDVRAHLERDGLAHTRGFRLAAFAVGDAPRLFVWNGEALVEEAPVAPLSSSSLDHGGAESARSSLLASMRAAGRLEMAGARVLEAFHASHAPARGPHSPCMHRDDARTVSASHVTVGRDTVRLRYAPGPPCRTPYAAALELPRSGRARST